MHDTKSRHSAAQWLFLDTWDVVLNIWHSYRFGYVPTYLEAFRKRTPIDHYLLCKADLPWVADPMRENQHDRDQLFDLYLAHLRDSDCSFSIISGSGDERHAQAVQALDEI
jgi:nicotinamide riboside kinase